MVNKYILGLLYSNHIGFRVFSIIIFSFNEAKILSIALLRLTFLTKLTGKITTLKFGKLCGLSIIIGLSFNACKNPNEKEIVEIKSLIAKSDETEKVLLALDTAEIFNTKRQLEQDLALFNKVTDTLTREEAFNVSDIFGSKKMIYRLTAAYPKFIDQIEISKKQLNNLKQDLENGLIKKEKYTTYYTDEKIALEDLNLQINKLITGIDLVVQKYETDRPRLLNLIELKQKNADNE